MMLLDTNVISELLKPGCHPAVLAWARRQNVADFHLAAIVQAELLLGVALLPEGRRRSVLADDLSRLFARFFTGRHVPFDMPAAAAFASIMATARRRGSAIGTMDGQIAAIAVANGLTVVSRDTAPFQAAGVELTDPWLTPV